MLEAIRVALNVITPILLIVGLSTVFTRIYKPDVRTISTVTLYIFVPGLVIDGLANLKIAGSEVIIIFGHVFVFSLFMAAIGFMVARLNQVNRATESAIIISVTLVNAANYGISFNRFAFGEDGESIAIVYYIATAIVANTGGVYMASRGSTSVKESFLNIFKIPLAYATLAGILLNVTSTDLPLPLARMVTLLSDAAIPSMLVLLGIQLGNIHFQIKDLRILIITSVTRLLIGPVIAFPITLLFGLSGLTQQVIIVQSAMPTAVISAVLTSEFGSDAEFTTSVILITTLSSIVTLSILVALMG